MLKIVALFGAALLGIAVAILFTPKIAAYFGVAIFIASGLAIMAVAETQKDRAESIATPRARSFPIR